MDDAKRILKSSNGITLVALVVTIIVLLILAGITISLTLSNNGLIKRTGKASNIWEKSSSDEQFIMDKMTAEIDQINVGNEV